MFESLSDRLQSVFSKLTGKGRLSEADVDAAMRETRLALLEADVNFRVVKEFVARVRERAVGADVMKSLTPGQMVVKIVLDELTALMGGTEARLALSGRTPSVIMLVGLQGSGKTTAVGKLANLLRKQGKHPLLVACDVYRPAAIDQLETLGKELGIPVYRGEEHDPVAIAKAGVKHAIQHLKDVVIVDTAGRLHIDEEMMNEAARIKAAIHPDQVLMVVDAMTGQDAVNAASAFAERVDFDGVIVSKLDGDARGGAALSVKAVTGKPILFASVGEKLDALEAFRPDGMARRILGMVDDFLSQLRQVRKMGSLKELMAMIPGVKGIPKDAELDEGALARTEAIIQSMTARERAKPSVINGSRRERIAAGAGVSVFDVNQLLKQFSQAQKMMKQLTSMQGKGGRRKRMPQFPGAGSPFGL